jgi:hypothetical protein
MQLGDDVGDVIAYRLAAHSQPAGDRRVLAAGGKKSQHLVLAVSCGNGDDA